MICKFSTEQAPKPILNSEQLKPLVKDLTEAQEGVFIGGIQKNWLVSNLEINPLRLRASDSATSAFSPYSLWSIPTLLGGGGVNEIRLDDKVNIEE